MPAPELTFTASGSVISGVSGYDVITVSFSSDIAYTQFECRATKTDEDYGVGKGTLVASFSSTPSGTQRTFEIYDDYLTKGDGDYRISLFARSGDGGWNDNHYFVPSGSDKLVTADNKEFLCMRTEVA